MLKSVKFDKMEITVFCVLVFYWFSVGPNYNTCQKHGSMSKLHLIMHIVGMNP